MPVMRMTERKMVELEPGKRVSFVPVTPNLGSAEFMICVLWKRGKVQDIYIYPCQQENITQNYHVKAGFSSSFSVSSWRHKGFERPGVWLFDWCKDHKTPCMSVYPPAGTDCFYVFLGSSAQIIFEKEAAP